MSHPCSLIVCACLLAVGQEAGPPATAPGATTPPAAPPAASAPENAPNEVTACFHDGSVVRKVVLPGSIELQTKYGKLTVPVRDIRRVEFGFRLSAEVEKQVEEAVRQLGGAQFRQREAAGKRLLELGIKAYPALLKAAQNKDVEVARRAQGLVQQIQQAVPAEQLQLKPHDTVITADCVLVGRLSAEEMKAKTKTFGEVRLKLTDLRSIHSPADAPGGTTVSAYRAGMTLPPAPDTPATPVPVAPPAPVPPAAPAVAPAPAAPEAR